MSAHVCTTLNPNCYRCDLHIDEIRGWIETLVVTRKGVVHDPDCSFVSGITSTATKWPQVPARNDRACSRCLPDGLPTLPTTRPTAALAETAREIEET